MSSWDVANDIAQLVLGVAGLGLGGYAGGRVSATARFRAEDRRRLLRELLPRLEFAMWNWEILDIGHTAAEITDVVDLLPWVDRESWIQVLRSMPFDARDIGVLNVAWQQKTTPDSPRLHEGEEGIVNIGVRELLRPFQVSSAERVHKERKEEWDAWYQARFGDTPRMLGELKNHLTRQLRSSLWRRLQDRRHTVRSGTRSAKRRLG